MTGHWLLWSLPAAVLMWVMKGLFDPTMRRLGERMGAWVLPDRQSWTFRIGWAIAKVASFLGPDRIDFTTGAFATPARPRLLWSGRTWEDPAAAIAELDEDLRSER